MKRWNKGIYIMTEDTRETDPATRIIAFYLPQFHPIPENDKWWGKGFTEWTNVAKTVPLFKGHYQPHLPADLGFYDLRLPEARQAQADLAREYGIHGFCYYHYWFKGKQLLERPFNEVLASGKPDLPFCLCWANETWSRRWLGEESHILAKQDYSAEDDLDHARALLPALADPRAIRIDNRPLFLIYRPKDLPEPKRTTDTFRKIGLDNGLPEPYLVGVNAHCRGEDCHRLGFDHTLDFRPQLGTLPGAFREGPRLSKLLRNLRQGIPSARRTVYGYDEAIAHMEGSRPSYPHIPSVFVGWDNTPRRGERAIVVRDTSPERFERYLAETIRRAEPVGAGEKLVFINAWNEWAEGNHLEPDQRFGRGFLEAVKRTTTNSRG
jgi:lipopolysaccharide biosynthesis protein